MEHDDRVGGTMKSTFAMDHDASDSYPANTEYSDKLRYGRNKRRVNVIDSVCFFAHKIWFIIAIAKPVAI